MKKTLSGASQLLSRQGRAAQPARGSPLGKTAIVAVRLGRGDDAVVVLHHLRGVAAAAVQRDDQRVLGAVVEVDGV